MFGIHSLAIFDYDKKEFICKGKHQYRQSEDNEWIYQCGRNMKD